MRELHLLSKHLYCVRHREDYSEAILDPPLHLPRIIVVISGVQAEALGPLDMSISSAWGDHRGIVWEGTPYSTYDCMRDAAGCLPPSGRLPSVFCCLEARNNRSDVSLRIFLAVALAVSVR